MLTHQKKPLDIQNNMNLKASQKLAWELNWKKQVAVENLRGMGKHEANKICVWNIKIGSFKHCTNEVPQKESW
jgi:hypothetical protein